MIESGECMNENNDGGEEHGSIGREILSWVFYIAVVILMTFFIITFVGQRTQVIGESMEPTLANGDNLIVEKLTYRFSDPKRFDIIVFPYQYKKHTNYIKRVIGLPGETVQIIGSDIFIDGEILDEDYGAEPISSAGIASSPITLAADEYFVLGDNRNHSSDSRAADVGIIKRSDIIGRAWLRIYPFNEFGVLKHQ